MTPATSRPPRRANSPDVPLPITESNARGLLAGQWQGTPQSTFVPFVGGLVQGYSSRVHTLSIGGATVRNLPVMLVNLPPLANEGVAGLIGDDVLSQFRVTIDCQARTMTLSR